MFYGVDQDTVPKKQPEVLQEGPTLTACDTAELERKKRKDEPSRKAQYLMHLSEMEAAKEGMPVESLQCVHNADAERFNSRKEKLV
ncbi:hypothetical protein MKX03_027639 [Papaver bracteatum]|nr:hypothetical protein MKX03_027639 [Papaver bracteatum]